MKHIAILSASVRTGRKSHRVALFLKNYMQERGLAQVEILDLKAYNFPLFEERLHLQSSPSAAAIDFAAAITKADGLIIVTPEYNGAYPASLKNAIDLLYEPWQRKPIALASVSSGSFAASQVLQPLLFSLWKIGALMVPTLFQTANVEESFLEDGTPVQAEAAERRAATFVNELLYWIAAKQA